jgi:hypothetical protein
MRVTKNGIYIGGIRVREENEYRAEDEPEIIRVEERPGRISLRRRNNAFI